MDLRDSVVGWRLFVSHSELESKETTHFVSVDDNMRFHFELFIHAEPVEPGVAHSSCTPLARDLLAYRRHEEAADAHFSLRDGTQVGFHKAIVCARSPYFFEVVHNTRFSRKEDNIYDASEFETEAFLAFLHLLYSDDVAHITTLTVEQVLEVLKIGDMYGAATVMAACDACLAHGEMLNVDTCGMLLAIANKFSRTALREAAMDYFRRNRDRVVNTPGFLKCITDNPDLSIQLLQQQ